MLQYQTVDADTVNGKEIEADGIRLASVKDIAAMKIAAITGRGTKKDFIDLFFLLNKFSLMDIISFYNAKYPDGSEFMALKSIAYFEDGEDDPMPYMLIPTSWEEVKDIILQAQRSYRA